MALNKVNYVDNQTIITAQNLNNIQDEIISLRDQTDNLLDNINFANPVNQQNLSVWSGGRQRTIDRWFINEGNLTVNLLSGTGLKLTANENSRFSQDIPNCYFKHLIGKPITLIVYYADGTYDFYGANIPTSPQNDSFMWYNTGKNFSLVLSHFTEEFIQAGIYLSKGVELTIKSIALYEGLYTDKNLPKLKFNSYLLELEKARYYYNITKGNTGWGVGFCSLGTGYYQCIAPFKYPMYGTPKVQGTIEVFTAEGWTPVKEVTSVATTVSGYMIMINKTEGYTATTGNCYLMRGNISLDSDI